VNNAVATESQLDAPDGDNHAAALAFQVWHECFATPLFSSRRMASVLAATRTAGPREHCHLMDDLMFR
jgi:hypothetical protein